MSDATPSWARLKPSALLAKTLWKTGREAASFARFFFYKLTPGLFFKRLGSGTKFYGLVRFGNVPGNVEAGRDCMLGANLFFSACDTARIRIGNACSINSGAHIVAVAGIDIGDGTMIGEYVSIRDQNHVFGDPDTAIRDQGFDASPIKIGKDVWIGRGVFIGRGIEIGDGCVIGANSVVTRCVPAYSVVAGAPAKIIGSRTPMATTVSRLTTV